MPPLTTQKEIAVSDENLLQWGHQSVSKLKNPAKNTKREIQEQYSSPPWTFEIKQFSLFTNHEDIAREEEFLIKEIIHGRNDFLVGDLNQSFIKGNGKMFYGRLGKPGSCIIENIVRTK
jgi:hypothetical protein